MIGTNDLGAARCLGEEKAILDAAPGTAERCGLHLPASACDQSQTHQQLHQVIRNAKEDWQGLWGSPESRRYDPQTTSDLHTYKSCSTTTVYMDW